MTFRPKFISFDCYGTLTRFRMSDMTRQMFAGRVPAERTNYRVPPSQNMIRVWSGIESYLPDGQPDVGP